jgi:hypothetical protein
MLLIEIVGQRAYMGSTQEGMIHMAQPPHE